MMRYPPSDRLHEPRNNQRNAPLCRRFPGTVAMTLALTGALTFGFSAAGADDGHSDGHDYRLKEAEWKAGKHKLKIKGKAPEDTLVTVKNAYDPSQVIGRDEANDDDKWKTTSKNPSPVPCRVSAWANGVEFAQMDVEGAPASCAPKQPGSGNTPPVAHANGPYNGTADEPIRFSSAGSSDPDGQINAYAWDFGDNTNSSAANPTHTYMMAGSYTVRLTVTDDQGMSDTDTTSVHVGDGGGGQPPTGPAVSLNSTSQNGTPGAPVPEQPFTGNAGYKVLASNDLGMHCGDLDTRISSILPPFNVLHAMVIQRGAEPDILTPGDGVEVYYSAASNPGDPILSGENSAGTGPVLSSMLPNGSVYKTNFWDIAPGGSEPTSLAAYRPFYPPGILDALAPEPDQGLPAPNVERLWLGDGQLTALQQSMPGISYPYVDNQPKLFDLFTIDQPFFVNFPFGYTAGDVNWYEAAGIPMTAFDDYGRENPWPLMRVQAIGNGETLASLDTVVPISGEANCGYCHNAVEDGGNGAATKALADANLTVTLSIDDPAHADTVPEVVSLEWAADINLLRLHDLKHDTRLIMGTTQDDPPGSEPFKPVVCQTCHYTPALDLAQVGPKGPTDPDANGREQTNVRSMSNVMHTHHAQVKGVDGKLLFPLMPPAVDNQGNLRDPMLGRDILQQTCYQCHPGRRTDCLRGAMANGGMLCQDCHGQMAQVGDDFSRNVTPDNPGAFELADDFYTNPSTPRVPWANEPGCGSCHTGDAMDNLHGDGDTLGALDGIRLMQAYRIGDVKATPIVPDNKRFAENRSGTGPGGSNPMLYRVSKGHEGVFCEACHGATHGIWPNKNPDANDNVAAMQLQGHTGTVSECSTCHTGDLGITLDGPHGMHPIGEAGNKFADGGHEKLAEKKPDACRACHGANGEGTVLSAMKDDRILACDERTRFCPDGKSVLFPEGHEVGCTECHGNEL